MDDLISKTFEQVIRHAERLGELSGNAILALACMYLGWRNYTNEKRASDESDKRTELRIKDAEVNLLTAKSLEKLADAVERIDIMLSERLPGRNHV